MITADQARQMLSRIERRYLEEIEHGILNEIDVESNRLLYHGEYKRKVIDALKKCGFDVTMRENKNNTYYDISW